MLNLKYPVDCKLIWYLFQNYLYEISLKDDEKCGSLTSVLNDLKYNRNLAIM